MSLEKNRKIVIERVQKEIIGPGSDVFQCKYDFSDEIIEGKPLQRYFSGILFPKQLQLNAGDNGEQEMKDEECKKKWVAAALNNDWADLESAWRKKISFVDPTDYYA